SNLESESFELFESTQKSSNESTQNSNLKLVSFELFESTQNSSNESTQNPNVPKTSQNSTSTLGNSKPTCTRLKINISQHPRLT
ncbi:hypothetical protein, partial [Bartonella sp. AC134YNZD]|uniref:hypothetical protein n=1 Tax=Bartonella sp. AC134YNZD TaxID=3243446 RepID=UPI0035D1254C